MISETDEPRRLSHIREATVVGYGHDHDRNPNLTLKLRDGSFISVGLPCVRSAMNWPLESKVMLQLIVVPKDRDAPR
ncbi:MAG: hypothetical protein WC869_00700 [Phycisphaerae bacterium]|jgi:hypothetical protein